MVWELLARPVRPQWTEPMKITRLETRFVEPCWCLLKVHTDEGLAGLGEPVVEGQAQRVAAVAAHCPLGSIALAACLQLGACIRNSLVREHVTTGAG